LVIAHPYLMEIKERQEVTVSYSFKQTRDPTIDCFLILMPSFFLLLIKQSSLLSPVGKVAHVLPVHPCSV